MTALQATIFQYAAVGCILAWLVAVLIVTRWIHKPRAVEPPQSEPQPYNAVDDAERVLYGYQQSEVSE